MYSVLESLVQPTTPLALRFASLLKGHGRTFLTDDEEEFKQLDEGPVGNKKGRWGVVCGCGTGLLASC